MNAPEVQTQVVTVGPAGVLQVGFQTRAPLTNEQISLLFRSALAWWQSGEPFVVIDLNGRDRLRFERESEVHL